MRTPPAKHVSHGGAANDVVGNVGSGDKPVYIVGIRGRSKRVFGPKARIFYKSLEATTACFVYF